MMQVRSPWQDPLDYIADTSIAERFPVPLLPDRPGQDLIADVERRFGQVDEKFVRALLATVMYVPGFQMQVVYKHQPQLITTVPGHLMDMRRHPRIEQGIGYGPTPCEVMVVGKMLGAEEVAKCRQFVGETSQVFYRALKQLGVPAEEAHGWYLTNLVKFAHPDPRGTDLPTSWVKSFLPVLLNEIVLCRPKVILCLGGDALKALLGSKTTLSSMVGTFREAEFGSGEFRHKARIFAAVHPAYVWRDTSRFPDLVDQLRFFLENKEADRTQPTGRYEFLMTEGELAGVVEQIRASKNPLIAVDCEWHGQHPSDPGSYVRTIQFSHVPGRSYCVVLHYQGGKPCFKPSVERAVYWLKRLLLPDSQAGYNPRVGGHFFRADLPWLISLGIDCRDQYAPADSPERCREEGGFDTGLMYHAYRETASFKLEEASAKLVGMPRYDRPKEQWLAVHVRQEEISKRELLGFGEMPDWVLLPYAAADADATIRLADRFMRPGGLLDRDDYGNNCWEPYWRAHRASLGILEMEMEGMPIDHQLLRKQQRAFREAYDALLADFRRKIRWPDFNPDSVDDVICFLFGKEYLAPAKRKRKQVPPKAVCMKLTPIKTTGKRPQAWEKAIAEAPGYVAPSVDKEVLGTFGHQYPLVRQLRDISFLGHMLSTHLRPVEEGPGGLESYIRNGRIHTHLWQTKETGRSSSSNPNLQNISNRREDDYRRILGWWEEVDDG